MRKLFIGSVVSFLLIGCGGVSSGVDEPADTDTEETDKGDTTPPDTTPPDTDPGSECLTGSQGCACTAGGGCDPTLSCEAGVCVAGDDGATGGRPGTGGEPSTGGVGEGGTTDPPSTDIPWQLTAVLVDGAQSGTGPGGKRLIIWTESTYGCDDPNGISSCTPGRDHSKLSVPITAEQLAVGSFPIPNNAFISETGPNEGADDCWGGGGSLSGEVEIKSISADSLVVRLSDLDVVDGEIRQLYQAEDINVVICE